MSDAPRRRAIPSTAALRFCGWQLDCRTRRFTNPAGTPVALLLAFLNAPQRPLSREYLLQATRVHEMFSIAASMCRFFACGYPTPRSVWMTHGALGSFRSIGFERRPPLRRPTLTIAPPSSACAHNGLACGRSNHGFLRRSWVTARVRVTIHRAISNEPARFQGSFSKSVDLFLGCCRTTRQQHYFLTRGQL